MLLKLFGEASFVRRHLLPLSIALVIAGVVCAVLISRHGKRFNVILITVDTLRADHLGAYGYQRATSPNIDGFAKEAILFRYAFSQASYTNPSLSSLMTGYYPHETKVLQIFHKLPEGALTLAEMLKAEGYQTAAFVSNLTIRRGSGFEQGFDLYDDRLEDSVAGQWPWLYGPGVVRGLERVASKTTRAALNWLAANYKKPFFLWVHYMDPHGPYRPPSPYNTMFVEQSADGSKKLPVLQETGLGTGGIPPYQVLGDHRDPDYYISQYDGEIRYFDESFGALMRKIKELGLFEDSIIIFTADHGEGMGEHNYYFAHEGFLYNELIHVPLLVRTPDQSSAGKEIKSPVALVDVVPTILNLLSIHPSKPLRGRSLLSPSKGEVIFSENYAYGPKHVMITDDLELIHTASLNGENYGLFNWKNDFSETDNLYKAGTTSADFMKVLDLISRLEVFLREDDLALGSPVVWHASGAERERLRALGYVQ